MLALGDFPERRYPLKSSNQNPVAIILIVKLILLCAAALSMRMILAIEVASKVKTIALLP
jgi:hypothetical protein